jgi:hypothetical protein
MARMSDWVRLPVPWVEKGGLKAFQWSAGQGSDCTAALMTLIALAHCADPETGVAKVTYDDLCHATGLSRAKLSSGLGVLQENALVKRWHSGRSTYILSNYLDKSRWAKIPARPICSSRVIIPFIHFNLRNRVELDALKLYILISTYRDWVTNIATISYDKIELISGIQKGRIKSAISLLVTTGLIYAETVKSDSDREFYFNRYRVTHVDSYIHAGTARDLIWP